MQKNMENSCPQAAILALLESNTLARAIYFRLLESSTPLVIYQDQGETSVCAPNRLGEATPQLTKEVTDFKSLSYNDKLELLQARITPRRETLS